MPSWSLLSWVKPNTPQEYSYIVKDNKMQCTFYSKETFEKLPLKSSVDIKEKQKRTVVMVSLSAHEAKKLMKNNISALENHVITTREDVFDRNAGEWQPGEPHQFHEPYGCVIS